VTEIAVERRAGREAPSDAAVLVAQIRLREIDMWRGLVIVLMALDHARVYFHDAAFQFNPLDPERTHSALYATRWITHLCAPSFVFLAGVSAYLRAAREPTHRLPAFLLIRGLWLIAIEITVISFGWAFALPYPLILQVIWAIGWSMIVLSLLVRLPRMVVLAFGIAITAGHNLLDPVTANQFGPFSPVWTLLHERGPLFFGDRQIAYVLYPILPWVGVMALGYGLGALFLEPAKQRDRVLLVLGAAMIAVFLILRTFNLHGDPDPWTAREDLGPSIMAFLDVHKYPPSLMYVLVTLGIGFALVPLLAFLRGRAARVLLVFGAVSFFFYVLHIYFIHGLAMAADKALGGFASGMGFSLATVYIAWIAVLASLYPLCCWWLEVKQRRNHWWLSYL
jgi:uncharacterized membrane protein